MWAELGLLRGVQDTMGEGVRAALRTCRELRAAGLRNGLERLLQRTFQIAVRAGDEALIDETLAEIEIVHRDNPCPGTMEVVFLARGTAGRDMCQAELGIDLIRGRRHRPALLSACVMIAPLADDPRPWLHEAYEIAVQCDATALREHIRLLIRAHGVAAPRARVRRDTLSSAELRIIELIRDGRTNRQIAQHIGVSEKTVETRLTRLFALTGCRSRVELAAASLAGRLPGAASCE